MLAACFQQFRTTHFIRAASSNTRPCLHEERRDDTLQKETGVLGIAAALQDTVTPGSSERGQCLRREGCKRLRIVTAAASAASAPAANPAASGHSSSPLPLPAGGGPPPLPPLPPCEYSTWLDCTLRSPVGSCDVPGCCGSCRGRQDKIQRRRFAHAFM